MIPPFQNYLFPFLSLMSDGKMRTVKEAASDLAAKMNLSAADLDETLESSGKSRHLDRCGWAKTYLVQAGLIYAPKKAHFLISPDGIKLANSGVTFLSNKFLSENYPSFAAFVNKKEKVSNHKEQPSEETSTPLERMESAYIELINSTIDDLLSAIKDQTPQFFENLVVQLLVKMGYGGDFEDAAKVTQPSNDGGIDGIIKEDALGLDKIYIQAKRWTDKAVSAPDIQQFIGALINVGATKGIYITTSKFTASALKAAQTGQLKVVLIDGDQLARYMVKYNLGVITARAFEVKRIDIGYFQNE